MINKANYTRTISKTTRSKLLGKTELINKKKVNYNRNRIKKISSILIPVSTNSLFNKASKLININVLSPTLKQINKTVDNKTISNLNKISDKILLNTKLYDKGVRILRVSDYSIKTNQEAVNTLLRDMKHNRLFNLIIGKDESLEKNILKNEVQSIIDGENSLYICNGKKIITSTSKLSLAQFHELGHAYNNINSLFIKNIKRMFHLESLVAPIFLISTINKGMNNKSNDKRKNKIPIICGTFYLPKLIDEAFASIKSYNLTKNVLPKEILKKTIQANLIGFSTYLLKASSCILGIYTASKIQDRLLKDIKSEKRY